MDTEKLLDALEERGAEVEDTLERLSGDEEFYVQNLVKLPQNRNILGLRAAVDAGDCETAKNEVHTLKGLALNLGLLPLADVCMDMLLDFRAGKNAEALAQMDAVEAEFNAWSDIIRNNG